MTTAGPLGRDSMAFRDKMVKYHGEIERLVYAAEILCDSVNGCDFSKDRDCPFAVNEFQCNLETIRETYGDHIEQHDCMVPPCQCAGEQR